jgi:hypothetical protein
MATKDGGSAFPLDVAWVLNPGKRGLIQATDAKGMTLRDYFAAQAMTALLSQMTYGNQGQHCAMYDPNDRAQAVTLAHLAYQAADAMLKAREP